MIPTRSPVLVVVVALSACATASRSDPPAVDSGIRGVVLAGPQCPVVTAESPCPDLPWEGIVRVTVTGTDGDSDVGLDEVATDEQGMFEIALPPAIYRIVPVVQGGGLPSVSPLDVEVTTGRYTQVTLTVDTGIR